MENPISMSQKVQDMQAAVRVENLRTIFTSPSFPSPWTLKSMSLFCNQLQIALCDIDIPVGYATDSPEI